MRINLVSVKENNFTFPHNKVAILKEKKNMYHIRRPVRTSILVDLPIVHFRNP